MRPRRLAFEQLEDKLSPSSFLIVMASIPESDQAELEQWLVERADASDPAPCGAEGQRLLQFVEEHTRDAGDLVRSMATPSEEQCRAADDWLRLESSELRELVATNAIIVARWTP